MQHPNPIQRVEAKSALRLPKETELPSRQIFTRAVAMLQPDKTIVFIVDVGTNIRYMSAKASRAFGHPAEEIENIQQLGMFLATNESKLDVVQLIPQIATGVSPSQLVNGGNFLSTNHKLGTTIPMQVGLDNTVINEVTYVVVLMQPMRLAQKAHNSWQIGKSLINKYVVFTVLCLSLASAMVPFLVELIEFSEVIDPVFDEKKEGLLDTSSSMNLRLLD